MNLILYLSCVVFIIGSLVWRASAQEGHDFESERAHVLDINTNPRVDIREIEMTPTQRPLDYDYWNLPLY